MASDNDPLNLGELHPDALHMAAIGKEKKKVPSELELQKEARLAEKEKRLKIGFDPGRKAAMPSEVPPPAPKLQDRSVLLDKVTAYRERFPHLKKRNTLSGKSTIDEILDELHYCELQLGSQNSGQSIGTTILFGTMVGIERFTTDYYNPLGLNLNGLGTVAQQNMAEFQPILDELMIKYNAGMYASPEWRLALAIGATVLTVNAANQNPEMARAVKSMNMAVNHPKGASDL